MAKIGFISLGCAKNQVDCERMMYRVQEAGHSVEYELSGCDVVVINTCGFTAERWRTLASIPVWNSARKTRTG